jgi:hypothetical protein
MSSHCTQTKILLLATQKPTFGRRDLVEGIRFIPGPSSFENMEGLLTSKFHLGELRGAKGCYRERQE